MSGALAAGGLAALVLLLLAAPSPARHRLRRLVREPRTGVKASPSPRPARDVPGALVLDLVAAVLAAGAPVPVALRLVATSLQHYGAAPAVDLARLARRHELALPDAVMTSAPAWARVLDRALLLARDAGVPPAALLVAAAAEERRRSAARRRLAAARLGVRVVLPTGLCLLPAFVLLTVVPMVVGLLGG